ncbi:MAG: hypothetical protein D3917_04000 [Candidatus Electrothrix sp. AX5]|nr:hypothetical protein [Candidatus Electrothrix sp. AX5]
MHITIRVFEEEITLEKENNSSAFVRVPFCKKRNSIDLICNIAKISQKYTDSYSLNRNESRDVSVALGEIGEQIAKDIFCDQYRIVKDFFYQYSPDTPIQIKGDHNFWIPWELLYFGEGQRDSLEGFLGFKRNIFRQFPSQGPKLVLKKENLKVGFLAHKKVAFSEEEYAILKQHEGASKIRRVVKKCFIEGQEFDPDSLDALHILHVAGLVLPSMHFEKSAILVDNDYQLHLSRIFDEKFLFYHPALILLNLRNNYLRKPEDIIAYVKLLIKCKVSGVIANELPVPARLAMEFSKRFYAAFLTDGLSFDKALKQAKSTMLEDFQNPFAMFYTPYAYVMDERIDDQIIEEKLAKLREKERSVSGMVTTSTIPADTQKTTILFLAANPIGMTPLRLDEEVREISKNLKCSKKRDNLILKREFAVTSDIFMQAILDVRPHIIHFSGHGEREGVYLEDEQGKPKLIDSETLAGFFCLFKDSVQCVLLNTCYAAAHAETIKEHVPHVIGMSSDIPDTSAISFTKGFYKAIGAGRDIPFAFSFGKAAMKLPRDTEYEMPILL